MNTLAVLLTSENLQCCPCQSLSVSANQIPRQLPIRMGERGGEREEEVKEGGGGREEEAGEREVMLEDKNTSLLDVNLSPPLLPPEWLQNL